MKRSKVFPLLLPDALVVDSKAVLKPRESLACFFREAIGREVGIRKITRCYPMAERGRPRNTRLGNASVASEKTIYDSEESVGTV